MNLIQHINSQPDLEDVSIYLDKPLMTLNNIMNKLQGNKELQFVDVLQKSESILNKYLPQLIDNYCALSLDYRNNVIIKRENNKEYTAKTLLLKNVQKIIEEINLLEVEFNENYTHKMLLQTRVLANLGHTKDLINNNTEVDLENTFDYNNFDFSTEQLKNKEPLEICQDVDNEDNDNDQWHDTRYGFFTYMLTVGFIFLTTIFVFMGVAKIRVEGTSTRNSQYLKNITSNLELLGANLNKDTDINTRLLITENIMKANKKDYLYAPGDIDIKSDIINKNNSGLTITYTNSISLETCRKFVKIMSEDTPQNFLINNKFVSSTNVKEVDKLCQMEITNKISVPIPLQHR